MKIGCRSFNIYLLLVTLVFAAAGCSSTGGKKSVSVLRLHLEANRDGTDRVKPVPIYRSSAVMVNVESSHFVSEANISEARVIEAVGGFALKLKFERRGAWLLEQYTTANRGKRIAVYAEFVDPLEKKKVITRWLGAPLITHRIADGVLTFTPDATREEANELVRGLNNLAKKLDDSFKW